ncbi:hypothetical protein RhiirB3_447570 [Rhizophagus irregularis]|nr:hypothetical protein RhiirB3_447570 [Rhizophagus irregularis]
MQLFVEVRLSGGLLKYRNSKVFVSSAFGWASEVQKLQSILQLSDGTSEFRRMKKPRFVQWTSEKRKPKDKDSFRWAFKERKPKDKDLFRWTSEERKPKDKDSFGWASEE